MPGDDLTTGAAKVCAVVVTFNRKTLLKECLAALCAQTRRLDEIIVVDNASTDGTDDVMRQPPTNVTYIRLGENSGGAGGFHEGIKTAFEKGHDWVWVMDDDAFAVPDALERLLDSSVMRNNKTRALASAVLNPDGSISLLHRRLFDVKKMNEQPVDAERYNEDYFETDTSSFVGLLIGSQAVREIGLPFKEFFIYFDDTEYSLRIRKRGLIFTIPGSKIVHGDPRAKLSEPSMRQQPFDWKRYYGTKNRIYTYRKHGKGGLAFYRSVYSLTLNDIKEALRFRYSRLRSIRIVLCGVLDGLRGKLGKNPRFLPR
jgi:rhamnopyranosyl-N-acetylglucosaminyl-diphospho-decaprenol beta-1,3/1,4-galactofuranosyltransferase